MDCDQRVNSLIKELFTPVLGVFKRRVEHNAVELPPIKSFVLLLGTGHLEGLQ